MLINDGLPQVNLAGCLVTLLLVAISFQRTLLWGVNLSEASPFWIDCGGIKAKIEIQWEDSRDSGLQLDTMVSIWKIAIGNFNDKKHIMSLD